MSFNNPIDQTALTGIYAGSLVMSNYTGSLSVVSDLTEQASPANGASAVGLISNVDGDMNATIEVTAIAGSSPGMSEANKDLSSEAVGIYGGVSGNLNGDLTVTAIGGASQSGTDTSTAFINNATATGLGTGIKGNVNETITVQATGGSATLTNWSGGASAQADALATGIDGDADGGINGTIHTIAQGGTALAHPTTTNYAINASASANATAFGINGSVSNNVNGSVITEAVGGTAEASVASGSAYASATAKAIGIYGNLDGDLNGDITTTAIGGSVLAASGNATAKAIGIDGGISGNLNGSMISTATTTNGGAYATGVGDLVAGDVAGDVTVTAVTSDGASAATATGVAGVEGNITGNITVKATGGKGTSAIGIGVAAGKISSQPQQFSGNIDVTTVITSSTNVLKTSKKDSESAIGIQAAGPMDLHVTGGSIHARAVNSSTPAYAIMGSSDDDDLSLANVDIVGDIALGDGINDIEILGDTRIEGDIYATGLERASSGISGTPIISMAAGANNFLIRSGVLTPVGTVRVFDLYKNMKMVAGSGLGFELYEDSESSLNSKLEVDGILTVEESASESDAKTTEASVKDAPVNLPTATLAASAATGQTAADIIGNSYEVVTATRIEGEFIENLKSLFYFDISQSDTNIIITITGLRPQDGSNSGAGSSIAQATVNSAGTIMNDLSTHAGTMRSALRSSGPQGSPGGSPEGPSGPSATDQLRGGEWLLFVRQLNDIGSQDSDSSTAGYDWNTSGFMLGAEKLIGEGFILGAAAGGAWTDIDGKDGAGGGASKMAVASVYANCFSDTWYTEAGLSCAHAWNDAERIATDTQRYMGDYNSDLYGLWLEAGYTIAGEKQKLEPYARTTYVSGNHDGYTDQGGTSPLTVESNGTDNWLVELGLRGSRDWEMENGDRLTLEAKAGWQCELLDSTVSANGSLLGTDQTLTSPGADRNALVLGLKVNWQIQEALALEAEYAPTLAGNWYNHAFNAAVKYSF